MEKTAFVIGAASLGVGLAVGGAIGYLMASGGPAAPPSANSTAAATSVPVATTVPGPAAAAPDGATRGPAASRGPAVATAPAGQGEGAITGTVVGHDGAPLSGVLVRAEPREFGDEEREEVIPPRLPPGAPPPHEDLDRQTRAYAEGLARQAAGRRETLTDSSGNYALPGLPARSYALEAWLVGYRVQRTSGESWSNVAVGERCDFKATPIRAIQVSVLLPDGNPPDQASISWKAAGGGEADGSASWRKADPWIELEPGTYEFTARANPHEKASWVESRGYFVGHRFRFADDSSEDAPFRSEPQTVAVGRDESQTLTFRLEGRPGILVKVVFPSPERPRTFRIAALRLDGAAGGDASLLLGDGKIKSLWLDEATAGVIGGIDPGTYLVGVTFRGGQLGPTATVAVSGSLATQELRVPPGEIRDWVKVWVRAPDGTPVHDAEIECGCRGSEGNGSADAGAKPEADGSYRVEHFEQGAPYLGSHSSFGGDGLGPGTRTYFIKVASERYGTMETTYDPARDREVTVSFAAPALLRVTISGLAGAADRDRASVSLEAKKDEGDDSRDDTTSADIDAAGKAKFPPVKPGLYEVVVRMASSGGRQGRRMSRWNGTEVARVPVTLGSGENAVTIPLAGLSDLVVTFQGEAPDLQRLRPDGVPQYVRGGEKEEGGGQVTFHDLSPGRYRLLDRGTGDMWVDVPVSGPVAFRPAPFNSYFLEVKSKGYLCDLGLRTGDLVVAIDGVEFKDRAGLDQALATAKTHPSTKFTIERGGARFDLTADGRKFDEDDGSYYQPWAR